MVVRHIPDVLITVIVRHMLAVLYWSRWHMSDVLQWSGTYLM